MTNSTLELNGIDGIQPPPVRLPVDRVQLDKRQLENLRQAPSDGALT
ncbi:hypothetical protein [Roseiflexus sp.]